ncbi:hypothetical protein NWFMUON74_57020 [Nocardia wallacei]|uniref:PepSY domain-containing protein n=1 Tax=Nocardia wallacei TaxID=480035 RepID=A0A7G1KS07_9NOCA|nr:hypothetical protein NWFMUON74_57020 [Nocardia wallacei]
MRHPLTLPQRFPATSAERLPDPTGGYGGSGNSPVTSAVAAAKSTAVANALAASTQRASEPTAEFDELEIDTDDTGAVVWKVDLVRGDHSDVTYTVDPHDGDIIGSGSR